MRRAVAIVMALGLVFVLTASAMAACGCGDCGPACGPACGCGCGPACGPCDTCGPCGGCRPDCCIRPLAPVEWVLRLLGGSCGCGGCSRELYWGDDCCGSAPCSPCDACGNYVGPGCGCAGPVGHVAPNGYVNRPRSGQYNGYANRTPAARPMNYGYANRTPAARPMNYGNANRMPMRGQAVPAGYQAAQSNQNPQQPRIISVTEQVVPAQAGTQTRQAR